MSFEVETIEYTEKRQTDGKTKKKICRCIKRHLARLVYGTLNATNPTHFSADRMVSFLTNS
jgi:hypothetical protein